MKLSLADRKRLKTKYGPWALVTGSSSGIGRELAERLAEAGLNVVIHGRRESELRLLATSLEQSFQVKTFVIASDVSTPEGVQQILLAVKDLPIGLVAVSAGFGTSGQFHQADLSEEVNMLRVNCEALLLITHHFAKQFAKKRRGGIVLLSSLVAFQGVPYAAHYAATKAYVQSLGEAIAIELKPLGVDVLCAAPGPVASGFGSRANMNMALTPRQIGVPILKALGRTSNVLPGLLTKILVGSLRTVPRWAKVRIMEKIMGEMTAHHR